MPGWERGWGRRFGGRMRAKCPRREPPVAPLVADGRRQAVRRARNSAHCIGACPILRSVAAAAAASKFTAVSVLSDCSYHPPTRGPPSICSPQFTSTAAPLLHTSTPPPHLTYLSPLPSFIHHCAFLSSPQQHLALPYDTPAASTTKTLHTVPFHSGPFSVVAVLTNAAGNVVTLHVTLRLILIPTAAAAPSPAPPRCHMSSQTPARSSK